MSIDERETFDQLTRAFQDEALLMLKKGKKIFTHEGEIEVLGERFEYEYTIILKKAKRGERKNER